MTCGSAIFDCKCVLCGYRHIFREAEIDPEDGPICPKCMGPMVVDGVEVKELPRQVPL